MRSGSGDQTDDEQERLRERRRAEQQERLREWQKGIGGGRRPPGLGWAVWFMVIIVLAAVGSVIVLTVIDGEDESGAAETSLDGLVSPTPLASVGLAVVIEPTSTPTPLDVKNVEEDSSSAGIGTPAASTQDTTSEPIRTAVPTPTDVPLATMTPTPIVVQFVMPIPTPTMTPAATVTPTPTATPTPQIALLPSLSPNRGEKQRAVRQFSVRFSMPNMPMTIAPSAASYSSGW